MDNWDKSPNEYDKLSIKYWKTAFKIIAETGNHNMSHHGFQDIRLIFVPMVSIVAMMCLSDKNKNFTPFLSMFLEIAKNRELNLLSICRSRKIQDKHFYNAAYAWITSIVGNDEGSLDTFVKLCTEVTKTILSVYQKDGAKGEEKMNPMPYEGNIFVDKKTLQEYRERFGLDNDDKSKITEENINMYRILVNDVRYVSNFKDHEEYTGSYYMLEQSKTDYMEEIAIGRLTE